MHLRIAMYAFFLLLIPSLGYSLADSTGLKIFGNGKVFISHKVEQGEGLYGIARRYGVTIEDIYAYNPELKTSGLKAGHYVYVVTKLTPEGANWLIKKNELIAAKEKARQDSIANGVAPPQNSNDNVVYYTAKLGETLFSISKLEQCKFTVEELKKWNNLTSNSIKEGDRLIIAFRKEVIIDTLPKEPEAIKTIVDGKEGQGSVGDGKESPSDSVKVEWKDVQVEGLAAWKSGGAINSRKSFALYNDATPGTVIRVLNTSNQKVTYVRVVGPIEKSDNKDVILIVSEAAAKRLGVKDKYFRVRIIYATEDI